MKTSTRNFDEKIIFGGEGECGKIIHHQIDPSLFSTKEMLDGFIEAHGCAPEDAVQVERIHSNGKVWYVRPKTKEEKEEKEAGDNGSS